MTSSRRAIAAILLLVAAIVGCETAPQTAPRLTDPTEVLREAVRRLATTATVHVRVVADVRTGQMELGDQRIVLEGDLDLERRDAAVQLDMGMMGFDSTMRFILLGEDGYMQFDQGGGRWQHTRFGVADDPRSGIPPTDAIVSSVLPLLSAPGVVSELVGMEDCGGRSCYHVRTTISGEFVQEALGGGPGGVPPGIDDFGAPPAIGDVTLDIHVDEGSRQPLSVSGSAHVGEFPTTVSITLSNHDAGLRILAPPPNLVDRFDP